MLTLERLPDYSEKSRSLSTINAAGAAIKGRFTLMPLNTAWPPPLTKWFGPASAEVPVYQPYYHSYDQ